MLRLLAALLLVGGAFRLLGAPVSEPLRDRDPGDEGLAGLCPRCVSRNRERIKAGRIPHAVGRLRFASDGSAYCPAEGVWLWPVREGEEWIFLRRATAG